MYLLFVALPFAEILIIPAQDSNMLDIFPLQIVASEVLTFMANIQVFGESNAFQIIRFI